MSIRKWALLEQTSKGSLTASVLVPVHKDMQHLTNYQKSRLSHSYQKSVAEIGLRTIVRQGLQTRATRGNVMRCNVIRDDVM